MNGCGLSIPTCLHRIFCLWRMLSTQTFTADRRSRLQSCVTDHHFKPHLSILIASSTTKICTHVGCKFAARTDWVGQINITKVHVQGGCMQKMANRIRRQAPPVNEARFSIPRWKKYMFKGDLAVGSEVSSLCEKKKTIRTIPMKRSLLFFGKNRMVLRPTTQFLHLTNNIILTLVQVKRSSLHIHLKC